MHIIMPSFGGKGGFLFKVSATRGIVVPILRTYWSCFIIMKRFVSYVCMCSSNSVCFFFFFGMIIYVVDCRQSICSYNVESSFVE